jgi:hypothetical protein
MIGFFRKRRPKNPMKGILTLDDSEFFDFAVHFFGGLDRATLAHTLVAYANLRPLVAVVENEARRRNEQYSLKTMMADTCDRLEQTNDEVNERRFTWFFFAQILIRIGRIATAKREYSEGFAQVWCDIARAAHVLNRALPDNVVWTFEEKD